MFDLVWWVVGQSCEEGGAVLSWASSLFEDSIVGACLLPGGPVFLVTVGCSIELGEDVVDASFLGSFSV